VVLGYELDDGLCQLPFTNDHQLLHMLRSSPASLQNRMRPSGDPAT
jgi:hypothetical protein